MTQDLKTVELRELDKENYRDILRLEVAENQRGFVATNAISLAQAHFHEEAWYRGIYVGDLAVGFVMLEINSEKPEYYLWRYMIDQRYQRKGYGLQAMQLLIDKVRDMPEVKEFLLSYVPGDGSPQTFYEKLGFVATGEVEEGEIIMSFSYT